MSSVLVAAHRSLSKCKRNRKYPTPNNTIIVVKIIAIVCQRISVCELCKFRCVCITESMSIECRGVARRDCRLSSSCSVGIVSSCSCWDSYGEIIGTLSGRKICRVLSSVCIDPRSVGYICKSFVDTWQADALISSPAFTSICVWGGVASFPGQRTVSICVQGGLASLPGQRIVSCRGVGK